MSLILSCHAGSLNAFALKLRANDTVESVQSRAAHKLALPGEGRDIVIKYLYCDVYYTLEDEDDFEVFTTRHANSTEVTLLLSSPAIPTHAPSSLASLSSIPSSSHGSSLPPDRSSIYSNSPSLYGRGEAHDLRMGTSMHLVDSSDSVPGNKVNAGVGAGEGSVRSGTGTEKGRKAKSLAPSVPEHKIKFEEFHNQLGVRTFIGSIGPVENVRMMMKAGHRACYMSRAFAQQHAFIPKDAAPGFYGFSGITNLGNWPIKVGKKTVEQQVMLVENSYFPIILGRSFMEKRGVKTDPLDQTWVRFMDTGETVPTDLVVVKDAMGGVIPIS